MFVTGFAIAPTLINGNALVQQLVPPARLTEGLTWVGTSLGVGVSFGSSIAGSRIDADGSHGGFLVVIVSAVLALVATLAAYRTLRPRPDATTADVRVPTSVSKASTRTGLVYVYEHPAADEITYPGGEPVSGPQDPWYLTALDARTGKRRWSVRTGSGLGFNNNYAPITLGPDGTAYVGVLGGILSVKDS